MRGSRRGFTRTQCLNNRARFWSPRDSYGFYNVNGDRVPTHWGDVRAGLVAEDEWLGGLMG